MASATWTLILAAALTSVATAARAADGARCASPADCASRACVDGVCCEKSECRECERCDHPDNPGQCTLREPGYPSSTCLEGYVCDGSHSDCIRDCHAGLCARGYYCSEEVTPLCRRKLEAGAACAGECPGDGACNACDSGHCVDGVCCNTVCVGDCVACTNALKGRGEDGVCGDVAVGQLGRRLCEHDPAPSCMRTGQCDGNGACAFHAAGTLCGQNLCVKDTKVDLECDGQGQCAPHLSQRCGGDCDSDGGCAELACSADGGCDAGQRCDSGGCDAGACDGGACKRIPAAACTSDVDCSAPLRCDFDGRCVDPAALLDTPAPCAVSTRGRAHARSRATWGLLAAFVFVALRISRRRGASKT